MPEEYTQNTPKGQIRTMADDLVKAKGEKVAETKEENAEPKNTEPLAPKPQDDTIVESLDDLLPLEESDVNSKPQTPTPAQNMPIPENLPTDQAQKITPPEPPRPPSPAPQETMGEKTSTNLESEIFPDPNLDSPDAKTEAESSSPLSLGDEEVPSETPEELLGLNKKEGTTESVPPPPKPEPDSTIKSPEEKKEYKTLSPEPKSFELSMGKPGGLPHGKKTGSKNTTKMLIFGSLAVLGLVLAGALIYFFFFGGRELIFNTEEPEQEEPYQTPDSGPTNPPPPLTQIDYPSPLIRPDFEQEGLVTANTEQNALKGVIGRIKSDFSAPSESITYLPIQLGSVPQGGEAEFVNLRQLLEGLNISTPGGFYDAVENDLMFYAYSPGEEERIMCQNNLISESDCYGVRLGLVIKAKEGREADLNTLVTEWINQISSSGIDSLVLNSLSVMPTDLEFSNEEYQSTAVENAPVVNVQYVNLPMPSYNNLALSTTAIDIAVVNEYMVISTSKRSMLSMIDKILQQQ